MACSIANVSARADFSSFDPVTGAYGAFYISGTATECRADFVTISITRADGTRTGSNYVPVDSAGGFSAQFQGSINCDELLEVVVTCPHEVNCRFTGSLSLSCCPAQSDVVISVTWRLGSVSDAELQGMDCVAPAETYTFAVTTPTGAGYSYDWTITEGRRPGDPPDVVGGGNSFALRLPGDGIRRTVLVEIHPPGGCNSVRLTRSLVDCSPTTCPKGF